MDFNSQKPKSTVWSLQHHDNSSCWVLPLSASWKKEHFFCCFKFTVWTLKLERG